VYEGRGTRDRVLYRSKIAKFSTSAYIHICRIGEREREKDEKRKVGIPEQAAKIEIRRLKKERQRE